MLKRTSTLRLSLAALLVFGGLVYRMNREDDARELEAVRRRLRARARKERADS